MTSLCCFPHQPFSFDDEGAAIPSALSDEVGLCVKCEATQCATLYLFMCENSLSLFLSLSIYTYAILKIAWFYFKISPSLVDGVQKTCLRPTRTNSMWNPVSMKK